METLRGWDRGEHTAYERGMPCTHPTYRKGDGPGVIVIHEMPGLTRGVVRFAEEVVAAGYTVVLPHLFGPVDVDFSFGKVAKALPRICVSRDFTKLRTGVTTPVAGWLQSLARTLHDELGGPGVGALGMCFTGGFALAMMLDAPVAAPVVCQPSAPFPFGQARAADVNLAPADLAIIAGQCAAGARVLGVRYSSDRATGTRFETLSQALGEAFLRVELPGEGHSTVAEQRSQVAVDAILDFFAGRLRVAPTA